MTRTPASTAALHGPPHASLRQPIPCLMTIPPDNDTLGRPRLHDDLRISSPLFLSLIFNALSCFRCNTPDTTASSPPHIIHSSSSPAPALSSARIITHRPPHANHFTPKMCYNLSATFILTLYHGAVFVFSSRLSHTNWSIQVDANFVVLVAYDSSYACALRRDVHELIGVT